MWFALLNFSKKSSPNFGSRIFKTELNNLFYLLGDINNKCFAKGRVPPDIPFSTPHPHPVFFMQWTPCTSTIYKLNC